MTNGTLRDLVLDASVAVKWFIPEEHSEAALRFRTPVFSLHVPAFFTAEFANVILKKVLQRREMTVERGREILEILPSYRLNIDDHEDLARAALDLALEIARPKLAIYDFIYLALAIQLDCGYLTADRVFFDAIKPTAHGSRLVWVADPMS